MVECDGSFVIFLGDVYVVCDLVKKFGKSVGVVDLYFCWYGYFNGFVVGGCIDCMYFYLEVSCFI